LGKRVTDDKISKIFQEADKDKSGTLDQEEFVDYIIKKKKLKEDKKTPRKTPPKPAKEEEEDSESESEEAEDEDEAPKRRKTPKRVVKKKETPPKKEKPKKEEKKKPEKKENPRLKRKSTVIFDFTLTSFINRKNQNNKSKTKRMKKQTKENKKKKTTDERKEFLNEVSVSQTFTLPTLGMFYKPKILMYFPSLQEEIVPHERDSFQNPRGRAYDLGHERAFGNFGIIFYNYARHIKPFPSGFAPVKLW
jgi:hypothetical protein